MQRRVGYAVGWVVAVVLAVATGLLAVNAVGASILNRGPLGNEVVRPGDLTEQPDPTAALAQLPKRKQTRKEFAGTFGRFEVECRGPWAFGISASPASGGRLLEYDRGPADDVEAKFTDGVRLTEVEVFCNRGKPVISDIEYDDYDPEDG